MPRRVWILTATVFLIVTLDRQSSGESPQASDSVANVVGAEVVPFGGDFSDSIVGSESYTRGEHVGTPTLFRPAEPEWRVSFDVPAWLTEYHGTATVRGRSGVVDVTTRDLRHILDDVDFALAGRLQIERGQWGILIDGAYVNLSISENITPRIDLSAGFETAYVDVVGTYDLKNAFNAPEFARGWDIDLLAGGRYILLETDGIRISGPFGRGVSVAGKRDWVDPIFGGRVTIPMASAVDLSVRGDIGGLSIGSASHFTWNVEALCNIRCTENCFVMLGYRLLDIDHREGSGRTEFKYDVQMKGPIARIGFEF